MDDFPQQIQEKILELFQSGSTVREIAKEVGIEPRPILLYLTKRGFWSEFCSDCVLKRCFDCRGLEELGKPLDAQDKKRLIAGLRGGV